MKNHKRITALLAALLAVAVTSANATLSEAQLSSVKKAFIKVPAVEIAPKAAKIVAQMPAAQQQDMAVAIVRTVIAKNPAVAVSLVAAISAVAPEVAPAVAAEAAKLAKDYAVMIAIAAEKAAPGFATQIAAAVAGVVPNMAEKVMASAPRRSTSSGMGDTITGGSISLLTTSIQGVPGNQKLPPTTETAVGGNDPNRYFGPQ